MTTSTDLRTSIRTAARAIDQALSDAANAADHEPIDFAVGDHLAEARRQLAIALERI